MLALYVTGQPSTEYVSDETPMYAYANVHIALEKMRVRAQCALNGSPPPPGDDEAGEAEPPRVLVLGPENTGKTTVCKILTNYTIRAGQDWEPIYVNVDPSEAICILFSSQISAADISIGREGGPFLARYLRLPSAVPFQLLPLQTP